MPFVLLTNSIRQADISHSWAGLIHLAHRKRKLSARLSQATKILDTLLS